MSNEAHKGMSTEKIMYVDLDYYQTVIDTQSESGILKSEMQDLVNEVKEARKGIWTDDEVIHFAQRECSNFDDEEFMRERLEQYRREREDGKS